MNVIKIVGLGNIPPSSKHVGGRIFLHNRPSEIVKQKIPRIFGNSKHMDLRNCNKSLKTCVFDYLHKTRKIFVTAKQNSFFKKVKMILKAMVGLLFLTSYTVKNKLNDTENLCLVDQRQKNWTDHS